MVYGDPNETEADVLREMLRIQEQTIDSLAADLLRAQKGNYPVSENWFDDYSNIVALVRHLVTEEDYTASQILCVLDKPWHWTEEYEAFRDKNRTA